MQIPVNEEIGYPTVSATQLRAYGAGGLILDEQEQERGCPRQYKAKYVDRRVPEQRSDPLRYGALLHDVLYLMEEEAIGPEQALERLFPVDLDPAMWRQALTDLNAYLERGASPTDRYATIAVEQHLSALLYTDEDFGPIYYRGILDWLGFDTEDQGLMHVVDYKSNRAPVKRTALGGDVQMKGYHWLVAQNWAKYSDSLFPRIVVHLDLIKWNDHEWRYSPEDIEDWRGWAEAVCRKILRDQTAEPVLNEGCTWCPVRGDCPAIEELPAKAADLVLLELSDLDAKWAWREKANQVRLLLENRVKQIDQEFKRLAEHTTVIAGGQVWRKEPDWKDRYDMRALHEAMGDKFYDVVSTSKKAIETATATWTPSEVAAVRAAIERVADGSKVTRTKVEEDR